MKFSDKLTYYMNILECSGKTLASISNISAPIISGYKNGTKIPKYNSKQLDNLVKALTFLAKNKNIINMNEDIIRKELESTLKKNEIDFEIFRCNFNLLITTVNINISDFSKYVGYDASFISKIRSGIRKPYNLKDFAYSICKFTIK